MGRGHGPAGMGVHRLAGSVRRGARDGGFGLTWEFSPSATANRTAGRTSWRVRCACGWLAHSDDPNLDLPVRDLGVAHGGEPAGSFTATSSSVREARQVHRMITLALVTLLGVSGCVSVDSRRPPQPPPQLAPAEVRPPSLVVPPPSQAPAREELAATDPETPKVPTRTRTTTPPRTTAPPHRPSTHRPTSRPPARQQPAPRSTPAVRKNKPAVQRPAPGRQKPYDMRSLCRASDGVVSPSIAQLCRSTYGR